MLLGPSVRAAVLLIDLIGALECAVPCRSFINSDRAIPQGWVALDGLARLIATSASCGSFAALRSGIALSWMGGPVHTSTSLPRLLARGLSGLDVSGRMP